ncbi:hypothetical protein ACFL5V_06710 [Fibrobacterota bacterium]
MKKYFNIINGIFISACLINCGVENTSITKPQEDENTSINIQQEECVVDCNCENSSQDKSREENIFGIKNQMISKLLKVGNTWEYDVQSSYFANYFGHSNSIYTELASIDSMYSSNDTLSVVISFQSYGEQKEYIFLGDSSSALIDTTVFHKFAYINFDSDSLSYWVYGNIPVFLIGSYGYDNVKCVEFKGEALQFNEWGRNISGMHYYGFLENYGCVAHRYSYTTGRSGGSMYQILTSFNEVPVDPSDIHFIEDI